MLRKLLILLPVQILQGTRFLCCNKHFKSAGTPPITAGQIRKNVANSGKVYVQNEQIVSSSFVYEFETPCHYMFSHLQEQYDLAEITKSDETDFDRAWSIANWLRSQFGYGDPSRPVSRSFNVIEILQRGQKGERFRCGTISGAYIQCLLSLGIQGRVLNIANPSGKGHVVTEVWCNNLKKWVLFDVDNNVGYTVNKTPASAYELHKAWINQATETVELVRGKCQDIKVPDIEPNNKIDFYWHMSIKMRNNWFSKSYPFWHRKGNAVFGDLEWFDSNTPPRANRVCITNKYNDFYWTLNQVQICLKKYSASKSQMELVFISSMPDFFQYEIFAENTHLLTDSPEYTWSLHKGMNQLQICPVDKCGRKGISSSLKLEVL